MIQSTNNIKGWGADLNPKDRPGYPMWKRPDAGTGAHWDRPVQQEIKGKQFHSIERPNMTAVFGTTVPPQFLSGYLRRIAFKYSEGSWGHWLTLILADRVNVVEGIFEDLGHGHIPNVFSEMGAKAEWKYNKKGFIKKTVVVSVMLLAIPAFFMNKRRD